MTMYCGYPKPLCTMFTIIVPRLEGSRRSPYGWEKQRMRALVRDNFQCQHPGCSETRLKQLTVHHLIKKCHGGSDNLDNLQTLCIHHHRELHSQEEA